MQLDEREKGESARSRFPSGLGDLGHGGFKRISFTRYSAPNPKTQNLYMTFVSNRFHHIFQNDTPFPNLLFESPSPTLLSNLQEIAMLLYPKHFLARALLLRTLGRAAIKRLDQRIMDDPQLLLDRVPIRSSPPLDREVPIVDVGEFEDL